MANTRRPFLPQNRNGILIDAIAIVANLVLFPFMLTRVGSLFDRSFSDDDGAFLTLGGLMVAIMFGRLAGLYMKRHPMQTRLEGTERTSFPIHFFLLNIGVFVMNAAFTVTFITAVAASLGLVEISFSGQPKTTAPIMVAGSLLMLVLTAAEIYLIYRLSVPLTDAEKELAVRGHWLYDWRGEFAADFGLFAYMMVWQVFYNDTAKLFMTPPPNSPDTWEYRIFSAVFLFIVFLIFYLSPRTVFLIEDRKYLGTWLFIFGVYLASVLRYW